MPTETRPSTCRFHQFAVPYFNSGNAPRSNCFAWYIYTAIVAQIHITAVEIILAVRGRPSLLSNMCSWRSVNVSVRVIQQKSPHRFYTGVGDDARVYIIRVCGQRIFPRDCHHAVLHSLRTAVSDSVPHASLTFLIRTTTFVNNPSSAVVMITQTTLIGLTLIKHILAKRAGWGRTPLVSLLIRDGTITYFITCGTSFTSDIACYGSFIFCSDLLHRRFVVFVP